MVDRQSVAHSGTRHQVHGSYSSYPSVHSQLHKLRLRPVAPYKTAMTPYKVNNNRHTSKGEKYKISYL